MANLVVKEQVMPFLIIEKAWKRVAELSVVYRLLDFLEGKVPVL